MTLTSTPPSINVVNNNDNTIPPPPSSSSYKEHQNDKNTINNSVTSIESSSSSSSNNDFGDVRYHSNNDNTNNNNVNGQGSFSSTTSYHNTINNDRNVLKSSITSSAETPVMGHSSSKRHNINTTTTTNNNQRTNHNVNFDSSYDNEYTPLNGGFHSTASLKPAVQYQNYNSSITGKHTLIYSSIPESKNSLESLAYDDDDNDNDVINFNNKNNKRQDDYVSYQKPDTVKNNVGYDDDNDDENWSISTASSLSSLATYTTVIAENFRDNLLLPFIDEDGKIYKVIAGISSLCIIGTILGIIMPKNDALQPYYYQILSNIIGYNYFLLWSMCFYPQILLNYRTQSTKGLSIDFVLLNCMGWTYYTIYLCAMYYNNTIREMYIERYHPHQNNNNNENNNDSSSGHSTVQFNDVLFTVHATVLGYVCLFQIFYYKYVSKMEKLQQKVLVELVEQVEDNEHGQEEGKIQQGKKGKGHYDDHNNKNQPPQRSNRGNGKQRQSSSSKKKSKQHHQQSLSFIKILCHFPKLKLQTHFIILPLLIPSIVMPIIIQFQIFHMNETNWLDYLYMLSYFKIFCTVIKYTKQVYYNYSRQTTKGWNIWYNFLECIGAILSMIQIISDSIHISDITGITGNFAKFLLGFVTISFDILFFMQHYIWYNTDMDDEKPTNAVAMKQQHIRARSRFELPPEVLLLPEISFIDNDHQSSNQQGLIMKQNSTLSDDDIDSGAGVVDDDDESSFENITENLIEDDDDNDVQKK